MALGELGLNVNDYYRLTQRQFVNTVNGYRRKEDLLSRERWHISRKIMYAFLCKYLGENGKETDIITFSWEVNAVKKMTEQEFLKAQSDTTDCEVFFANWDKRKAGVA